MSMLSYDNAAVVMAMKQELEGLGYSGGLLQEDYEFVDIFASEYGVKRIPLAAFSQEPTSYRNASFGVVVSNGRFGPSLVQEYKSLGSPQLFEVRGDQVLRWKVAGEGQPSLLDQTRSDSLPNLFAKYKEEWSPGRVLRAKSGGTLATQIDFMDLGLLPLLDTEVRTKLDQLLRDTVSLAIRTYESRQVFTDEDYPSLLRLIFRLVASKVLADRHHPGDWAEADPKRAIETIEGFYFSGEVPEPVLNDLETQSAVWERIRNTFYFQNLSVDALAYAYENTLVDPEARKSYGIHSTPPAVAEYIVRNLPFDTVDQDDRRVFEPFSGHSVFLIAAMQRMRELLPDGMTPQDRHQYFVSRLSGIELDHFAREVARLSLMLADYPNPDGWRLHGGDALQSRQFDEELARANIVLCNPPFESFTQNDRDRYQPLASVQKPAEVLHRVLKVPPQLLGFVLPRIFLTGREYQTVRDQVGSIYPSVELLALPDRVFGHSEAESVLLMASRENPRARRIRKGEVYHWDSSNAYFLRPSYQYEETVEDVRGQFSDPILISGLKGLWDAISSMGRLREFATIKNGIRHTGPFHAELVSNYNLPGFSQGLHRVEGSVEPYLVLSTVFLNADSGLISPGRLNLPWDKPKVVVNVSRRSRGPWSITASPDYDGLMLHRNFHGVWPTGRIPPEVLAAVLNGPVANAFVSASGDSRYLRIETLGSIPVPDFEAAQLSTIANLVEEYRVTRARWLDGSYPSERARSECSDLLLEIDAEVLKAYQLGADVEQILGDYFSAGRFKTFVRPGPVNAVDLVASQPLNPIDKAFGADQVSRRITVDDVDTAGGVTYISPREDVVEVLDDVEGIIGNLRYFGLAEISERLEYLYREIADDPDELPISLESLRAFADFVSGTPLPGSPGVSVDPYGYVGLQWRIPDPHALGGEYPIEAVAGDDDQFWGRGDGVLAMLFLPSGLVKFYGTSGPVGQGLRRLRLGDTVPQDSVMSEVEPFLSRLGAQ